MEKTGLISNGEIRIEPVSFIEINQLKIQRNINEHVFIEAVGRISEEEKEQYDHGLEFGTELIVKHEKGQVLFRGLLTLAEINHQGECYTLRVQAYSHTILLDMASKTRPFHEVEASYEDIIRAVTSEYKDADTIIRKEYQAKTGQFFMQYRETDWEFLKRLASYQNQGILADSISGHPAYYIGIPEQYGAAEKNLGEYQVTKDLKAYKKALEVSTPSVSDTDYITYTIRLDEWVELGEEINCQGQRLYVKSVHTSLEQAVLVHDCELCVKEGLAQEKKYHEKLAGKSVKGTVEEVKRDLVKINVQGEAGGENAQGSCWFPYSTVYASKDGSGWYCMPEKGDKVRIIFPDSDEKNVYASSSVSEYQPQPGETDRMADYQKRYIRNPQGMELSWTPEQVSISANGASIATLDRNGTLTLSASSKIILRSEGDIVMEAGNQVKVNASDSIHMICGGKGEINISKQGVIELKGNKVYTN